MNYKETEVSEPAVAYCPTPTAEAWESDAADEGAPESITVNSYEELCQKLAEGRADIEAGRVISLDDAIDNILRDIANGTI